MGDGSGLAVSTFAGPSRDQPVRTKSAFLPSIDGAFLATGAVLGRGAHDLEFGHGVARFAPAGDGIKNDFYGGRRHLSAVAAWPLAARAQQSERVRRIGFLRAAPPSERELEGLLRGLADHGWVQGRNFVLLPQWGDGQVARLPELAVLLVNTGVDIILADGAVTTRAARAVTATIPIVMTASADPFVGGLVQSLARPGGNVTGFSTQATDIAGKVLETFKGMVPGLTRVAILIPREARNMFAL